MNKLFRTRIAYCIYLIIVVILSFFIFTQKNDNHTQESYQVVKNNNMKSDANKYIILSFDDGWSSQYKAFKMLKPFKGTLYISSALIGQKDRLTISNLTEMYNSGWDISNHTVHHTNLTKVSSKKAYEEIYGCSSWIAGHGFTRDLGYKHFAYPEGGVNKNILQILKKQKFLTARTANAGNSTEDLLQLGRTSLVGMTKENIRENILSDKKIIILSIHRIVPDDTLSMTQLDLKESYLKEIIQSIYDSKRKVVTITEWYKIQ